ncbi:MAG: beta-ketoacyl-ACP synthase II [Spirochaetales bacterium]|nr:beta-ketoacyl-ACP synthase II [Spirochaetales bacterium]
MKKRIVITGMGTVNPLGNNVNDFWTNIRAGKCGITLNDRFDTTEYASKIAGLVKDFNASEIIGKRESRSMAHFTQYAVAASMEAMKQAGLAKGEFDEDRAGVVLGNGIGGFEVIEEALEKIFTAGPRRVHPMTIPKMITNEGPANVAITHGCKGPVCSIATACASATDAIGHAATLIQAGKADIMITGGTEGGVTKLGIAGFNVIQALSTRNDAPEKACRPFDKDRDGFIHSEGAGILVIESLENAQARGAKILAEIVGYGSTCDANHLTAPHPEGTGAAKAMEVALKDAGLKPEDIDYINAHGTSTPTNDPLETKSIKLVFGDYAYKVRISSTKSMHGHCVGAAGGVEAIVGVKAIEDNYVPATINLDEPDPECDLDYTPNVGVETKVDTIMSNSLGFGGHNGILIITRFKA